MTDPNTNTKEKTLLLVLKQKDEIEKFSCLILKEIKQNLLQAKTIGEIFNIFYNNENLINLHTSVISSLENVDDFFKKKRNSFILSFIFSFIIYSLISFNLFAAIENKDLFLLLFVFFSFFCIIIFLKSIKDFKITSIYSNTSILIKTHASIMATIFDLVFFEDAEVNNKLKQLNAGEEQRKNFLLFSYVLVGKYFIQKKNFPISFLVCIMPEYINFCKRTLEISNYYKNFEFFFANSLDVKIPTKNQIRENIEKIKSYNS